MIEIIPMEAGHIPALALLEQQCFSSPWSEKALEEELHNPNARFLTALADGEIAGYVGMMQVLDEGDICNVAVFSQYRRMGVATALLRRLMADGAKEGLRFINLEVRESNTGARAFYEKMGFETVGLRKNFYDDPREAAVLMTCTLPEQQ